MDNEKIQAFNDQKAQVAEDRAKQEDMAFALDKVLSSQKGIEDSVKKSILALIKFIGSNKPEVSVTNQKDFPSYDQVVKAVNDVVTEVKKSNQALETTNKKEVDFTKVVQGLDKLSQLVGKLPTSFPTPKEVKIPEQPDYTDKFDEVKNALEDLPTPVVNVEKTVIPDNSKELEKIIKAVEKIKFPDIPKTDLTPLIEATKKVSNTINGLSFPVPNYVLPFKDVNGAAVQVQLDSSGNLPVSSSGSGGTQYADGAARGTATGTLGMVDDGTNTQSLKGDSSGRAEIYIADGYDAAQGGTTSPAATSDTGDFSLISLFKRLLVAIYYRFGGDKSAYVATISSSGNHDAITPASGNRIRVFWIGIVPNSDNSGANLFKLGFGTTGGAISTELYRGYAMAHWEVFTGTANQSVIINTGTSEAVAATVHYTEIT